MRQCDLSPQDLPRLRRGSYGFLRRYAAGAWMFGHGDRWEIRLPPDVERLPERKHFRVHARQEARRLADAQLYDLCPQITHRAVLGGSAIRERWHAEAVALAGRSAVVASMGIQAPTESGFVRWQDRIGYNELGAPIVACHWGPAAGQGRWLVWWSDTKAMAKAWAADAAQADNPWASQAISTGALPIFGPLWYDQQELLSPPHDNAQGIDPAGENTPARDAADKQITASGIALIYTTLATWRLLTNPGTAVHLSQQPESDAEQAADRAAGLPSRPITVATAAGDDA